MTSTNDERDLRAYLLGELGSEDQERIEERLLSDEREGEYVELLHIVEGELMHSYLRGTLTDTERREFEGYFLTSVQRRRELERAKMLVDYANRPKRPRLQVITDSLAGLAIPGWRAAITALLVLALPVGIWQAIKLTGSQESLAAEGLKKLGNGIKGLKIEGMVAGLKLPPSPLTRGGEGTSPSDNVRDSESMNKARADLSRAIVEEPGAESDYAFGLFCLAEGNLDKAIEQFDLAVKAEPKNAKFHNDLGAALLEKARVDLEQERSGKAPPFPRWESLDRSMVHLNRALELNGNLLEALFNRALGSEYLDPLSSQAEDAWRAYLERDSASEWAEEARRHLDNIESLKKQRSQSPQDRPGEFLKAHSARDAEKAWSLLTMSREPIPERLIWWPLLNDFLKLKAEGNHVAANQRLNAVRFAGQLESGIGDLARVSDGDPYIYELAQFYRYSSSTQLDRLAEAQKWMSQANAWNWPTATEPVLTADWNEALRLYGKARDDFERAGNKWEARFAGFLAAYSLLRLNRTDECRSALEDLNQACKLDNHLWLRAQVLNLSGSLYDRLGRLGEAPLYTEQALAISEHLSDAYGIQKNLALLVDHYSKLCDFNRSLRSSRRCLEQMTAASPGYRQMNRTYVAVADLMITLEFDAAAGYYAREALTAAREEGDKLLEMAPKASLAISQSRQNYEEAVRQATSAVEEAERIDDEQSRRAPLSDAMVQLGHVYRRAGKLQSAIESYDKAISYIESGVSSRSDNPPPSRFVADTLPIWLYQAHRGRFQCYVAQGNDPAAVAGLVFDSLEKYRVNINEEERRNSFFDIEQRVYDDAIDFMHSRNQERDAFEYSEKSRARSLFELILEKSNDGSAVRDGTPFRPLALPDIQQRMPYGMQIIHYAALDGKLLIWVISKNHFLLQEVRISLERLTQLANDFLQNIEKRNDVSSEGKELYRVLIAPIKDRLLQEQICVVPDKVLNRVPFMALQSQAGTYLINEPYKLLVSPSSSVFILCSERAKDLKIEAHERLLSVGDPDFETADFPGFGRLPSSAREASEIAKFYPGSPPVMIGADATESNVLGEMKKCDVFNIAAHCVVADWSPMHSKLLLAKVPGQRSNSKGSAGVLEASEIAETHLNRTRLAVLSACHSGGNAYYKGEGLVGMSRAFIAAGVPLVVGSLWKAEENATKDLIIRFHQYRKHEGLATVDALKRAQLDLLSDPRASRRHPYYWAAFITIGGHADF